MAANGISPHHPTTTPSANVSSSQPAGNWYATCCSGRCYSFSECGFFFLIFFPCWPPFGQLHTCWAQLAETNASSRLHEVSEWHHWLIRCPCFFLILVKGRILMLSVGTFCLWQRADGDCAHVFSWLFLAIFLASDLVALLANVLCVQPAYI
jgi:hypothetical protein